MPAESLKSPKSPQQPIKHSRPFRYPTKQEPEPPAIPSKDRTQRFAEKADIPNDRSRHFDHALRKTQAMQDSTKKTSSPPISPKPHPHRPFSPSALASKSGKPIKAFFRHRHSDSLPVISNVDTLSEWNADITSPLRRRSTQIKRPEGIELPTIPPKKATEYQPNNPTTSEETQDHRRGVDIARNTLVPFPKTDEVNVSSISAMKEEPPPRQPRRSLSFFRNAMKTKPVTKLVPPFPSDDMQDARIPPDTIRRRGPVSTPVSNISSSSSDPAQDSSRASSKLEKPLPLTGGLPPGHPATKDTDASIAATPRAHPTTNTASARTKQRPAPVKDIRPSVDGLDPKPPDRLDTNAPALRLLPLTSPQSATTSITVNLDSDPDREAHYLLRMACTYLTKTILPELKMARQEIARPTDASLLSPKPAQATQRTASEKADALRSHVYERILVMARMEKAWGLDWMLRGKDGFVVSDARKEKERDTFRRAIDDGVILCYLLLRLKHTHSIGGRGILLASSGASKNNLALASEMMAGLPLSGEGATIASTAFTHLSGIGVYHVARLIVALARLAGPQHPTTGIDSVETSNPASDEEDTDQNRDGNARLSQLTLAFQKQTERPPLLIRRLSPKSTISGTSTPKQLDLINLPHLAPAATLDTDVTQAYRPSLDRIRSSDGSSIETASVKSPLLPTPSLASTGGQYPLPFRRPILRVKQSFASSATSGNTSTADSRSRNSAWLPEFIPEGTDEIAFTEDGSSNAPTDAPFVSSPNRIVSFGLSDEVAQPQVKTFRSQTRYRVRVAKPKFSQDNLSANDSAITDEEDGPPMKDNTRFPTSKDDSEIVVLPSTPKRRYTARSTANGPQPTTSPIQTRPSRSSSLMNAMPMSPIAFPGIPPRTPRNLHSGILPQSLAGSRRTSYASSIGESTTSRHSRQIVEVLVNGKHKANYQLGNCIGKGQFGIVSRALDLATGRFVAIKRIDIKGTKADEVGQIMREVDLLQRLKHPVIVRYLGMARSDESLDIVLEFIEGGSLLASVKSFGPLNEELVAVYVGKILEGLNYLHSQDVVHCDLKAANILTTKTGNVKLSDFGVSLNLKAVGQSKDDVVGSPNWMAPEVIEMKGITKAADIWSLGATIIELITGKPPYHYMDNGMAVMYRIVDEDMEIPEGCSSSLIDFLSQCFRKNAKDRPSAEDLFEHEWVKSRLGLDPHLRHHDSIPFLRRISTDAFKLREERMTAEKDLLSSPGHQGPYTQDIFQGPKPLANLRSSLPAFEPPTLEKPVAHTSQADVAVAPREGLEEVRIRQMALEKLSGSVGSPLQASDDPPTRSRLFSFSSRQSRRSLPHASSFKDDSAKATGINTESGSDENTGTNSHAVNKGSAEDGKSDCALM